MIERVVVVGMAMGSMPPLRRARSRLPAASIHIPSTRLCCKISTSIPGNRADASPVAVFPIGTDVLFTVGIMPELPAERPCMAAYLHYIGLNVGIHACSYIGLRHQHTFISKQQAHVAIYGQVWAVSPRPMHSSKSSGKCIMA